jgi:serine/threonine protein kinase
MGQVWSAVHVVTGRRVAIKRLLLVGGEDDDEHADSQARARFIQEAQTASAVEHPNVVQVLDFVEPGAEPPLLVMELLQGETLAAKLEREHALSLEDTVSVLLPVVSAVGTAHSLGIIHRDLKPANIFLQQRGSQERVVKVLDFGIAKWVAQQPEGTGLRTETGSTLGTPCYMAPEQAIGERLIDHTVDVWSLGIILYECLAGARPVEGENAVQMVVRLLNTGIMPIERVVPTLPEDVARLIGRMLSRDAARRPKDLREVFGVLRKYSGVSALEFEGPSLAIAGDPAQSTRSVKSPADSPSFLEARGPAEPSTLATAVSPADRSPAIDAHAPTLRDESNALRQTASWEGQSVTAKVEPHRSRQRQTLVLVIALPVVALGAYLLARPGNAPGGTTPGVSSTNAASPAPAESVNVPLPAAAPRVASAVPAPQAPVAQPPPTVPPQASAASKHHSAKRAAQSGRPQVNSEDEDGTLDRK